MDVSYVILSQIFVLVNVQYAQNHNFTVIFFLFIPRVRGKMTKTELLTYREHPMDKVHILIENKKPVYMVYGDSDLCVPYDENGISLEKQYRKAGATLEIEIKKGCGHHPHGPSDYQRVINFFEKN